MASSIEVLPFRENGAYNLIRPGKTGGEMAETCCRKEEADSNEREKFNIRIVDGAERSIIPA